MLRVFANSDAVAKNSARLVCRTWQLPVELSVTSFKSSLADQCQPERDRRPGQAMLPYDCAISLQNVVYLLPNVQLLDLRRRLHSLHLPTSRTLSALPALTKLCLKLESTQLQSALSRISSLAIDIILDIVRRRRWFDDVRPCITASSLPARLVELRLIDVSVCFKSMQLAGTLTKLTALHIEHFGPECPCCRFVAPPLALCNKLASLSLARGFLEQDRVDVSTLSALTHLTCMRFTGCPGEAMHLLRAVGSTLQKLSLALERDSWFQMKYCALIQMKRLTHLELEQVFCTLSLEFLSSLPNLTELRMSLNVSDTDGTASRQLRKKALTFSGKLQNVHLDLTKTKMNIVPMLICQLFACAKQLQHVQLSSCNASSFVKSCEQIILSLVTLDLATCAALIDQGLADFVRCFPSLTDIVVGSPVVTMSGVDTLTSLTRLQSLDISNCSAIKAADLKDFIVSMRHLGVLRLAPQVAKALCRHKRTVRQDLLLDYSGIRTFDG